MAGLDKHYDRNLSGSSREAKGRMPDRTVRQWKLLLFRAFAEIIGAFAKKGSLRLNYRGLEEVSFGDGTGPQFSVRLNSLWTILRIVRNTDLGCGESYMDEGWILERGDLGDFLKMVCRNQTSAEKSIPGTAIRTASRFMFRDRRNNPRKSRRNVAHHYDIGNDLYEAFLDEGMNYSCAFFEQPDQPLRGAQLNKLRTTIRRLSVPDGARVLDIGSGWGELSRLIASETGAAMSPGLPLPEPSAISRASGRRPWTAAGRNTGWLTIASMRRTILAPTTASSVSACSNMSAPGISSNISKRCTACWPRTGRR